MKMIVLNFALPNDNRSTDLPHIKKDTEYRTRVSLLSRKSSFIILGS